MRRLFLLLFVFVLVGCGRASDEQDVSMNIQNQTDDVAVGFELRGDKDWETYVKPDEERLQAGLSDLEYDVTQKEGTEQAGSSPLDKENEDGIYVDVVSGEPLFSSRDKFDSGTGWPSFVKPISDEFVVTRTDWKLLYPRTEVRSKYADSHLGHVFDDGPEDRGGKRYCMNGAAMRFVPKEAMERLGYGEWLREV